MFSYEDNFILIQPYSFINGLYIYWLPTNKHMSRLVLKNSVNIILNTVTATQSEIVLIDGFDFNYPVIPDETIRLLRYALHSPSSVKLSEVATLIENSQHQVVSVVNNSITMLFWQVGKKINGNILQNKRADYGKQIVGTLARQLEEKFGRNFEEKTFAG